MISSYGQLDCLLNDISFSWANPSSSSYPAEPQGETPRMIARGQEK